MGAVFGGWICVKAKNLDYDTVFNALKRGDFYSSTGPAIKSLYFEDNVIKIKTSAVKHIALVTDRRLRQGKRAEQGKYIYGAEFNIENLIKSHGNTKIYRDAYIRLEVTDKDGNKALTRAYFFDELGL